MDANERELKGKFVLVGGAIPEGLNDRSQAIYCLEQGQSRIRPVGHGLIRSGRLFVTPDQRAAATDQSYRPSGTGRLFGHIPGNKLPGYDHSVPPRRC